MRSLSKPDWASSFRQTYEAEADRLFQMRRRIWHGLPKELGDSYRVTLPSGEVEDTSELTDGDIYDIARAHAHKHTGRAINMWSESEARRKRRAGVGL